MRVAKDEFRGRNHLESILTVLSYGIVCGLIFPLMISSTFLKEINLSHGAGNIFGALFFAAYGIGMIVFAIAGKKRVDGFGPTEMFLAVLAVFSGNMLMMAVESGVFASSSFYAVITALLIGLGAALLELILLAKAAEENAERFPSGVALAYLVGAGIASFIFILEGPAELILALSLTTFLWLSLFKKTDSRSLFSSESFSAFRKGAKGRAQSVLCLMVLSFIFGSVSQVTAIARNAPVPIEAQAVLGIVLASLTSIAYRRFHESDDSGRLYEVLFPLVAFALILLPFLVSPISNMLVSVLVFAAYYLSGIHVRTLMYGSDMNKTDASMYAGMVLGFSALLMLAGVAFGSIALRGDGLTIRLSLVSLVSLFVLVVVPLIVSRVFPRFSCFGQESSLEANCVCDLQDEVSDGGSISSERDSRRAFASERGLTPRETEAFVLLCQGRTRDYIADEMGISANTVKGHIRSIYQKCGVSNKQDLLDLVEIAQGKARN